MTSTEALDYVIARLIHEASIRPGEQHKLALQRKLDAITALITLRDGLTQPAEGVSTS